MARTWGGASCCHGACLSGEQEHSGAVVCPLACMHASPCFELAMSRYDHIWQAACITCLKSHCQLLSELSRPPLVWRGIRPTNAMCAPLAPQLCMQARPMCMCRHLLNSLQESEPNSRMLAKYQQVRPHPAVLESCCAVPGMRSLELASMHLAAALNSADSMT